MAATIRLLVRCDLPDGLFVGSCVEGWLVTPFLQVAVAAMLPHAGGSPDCAECEFSWLTTGDAALAQVRTGPARFARLLEGQEATAVSVPQVWSPSAYVWHIGDVVRAWAERLHSPGTDPGASGAGFDPDELARARHYDTLLRSTGPWSLARSVEVLMQSLEPLATDSRSSIRSGVAARWQMRCGGSRTRRCTMNSMSAEV